MLNIMEATGSTKSPFEFFYREKTKIIGSFSQFERILYVTKRENIKKKMKDKIYKAIMDGYKDNHKRDKHSL